MIEIVNPVPVFDKDHNVIKFKYNDGLVVHDCLTNTLNISYIIVRGLISDSKTVDDVLSELKEHFTIFSDIKCHDRDFLLDLIKDFIVVDNLSGFYINRIFWVTKEGDYVMEYDKVFQVINILMIGHIWSVFSGKYDYNYHMICVAIKYILSDIMNLKIVTVIPLSVPINDILSNILKSKITS